MGLWFCSWKDKASFLVDNKTRAGAVSIAKEQSEDGAEPSLVRLLPDGVFRAEILDEGDGEDDVVTVDVDPATLFVLSEYEDSTDGPPAVPCKSSADGASGVTYACARAEGHDGEHEDSTGDMVWR